MPGIVLGTVDTLISITYKKPHPLRTYIILKLKPQRKTNQQQSQWNTKRQVN